MKVKIVSWNCQYGLCKDKASIIDKAFPDADIFVIQECRKSDIGSFQFSCKYKNWYGDDLDEGSELGVGIFSKTHDVEFTKAFDRDFRYVVPYKVKLSNAKSFILFAVWTKSGERGCFNYEKNGFEAVRSTMYKELLGGNAVTIGDFNTFAKNDEERIKFEDKMKPLANCADKESQGKNTYHHAGNNTDGIDDFCFASQSMIETKLEYIVHADWKDERGEKLWPGFSDHCPISVVFELGS